MARDTAKRTTGDRLAYSLGADVVGMLPDSGGGAFGAARLPALVATLRQSLKPGQGRRPGRPSNPAWQHHPKVPMSERTVEKLRRLAEQASVFGRKVSPMQVAAHLLEKALGESTGE